MDIRFYVATDERDIAILETFRKEGAVFMDDLLTIRDRRGELSWALMLTDFRGLVEQIVLSRAAFFYGHAMSSVAGGVMNSNVVQSMDWDLAVEKMSCCCTGVTNDDRSKQTCSSCEIVNQQDSRYLKL